MVSERKREANRRNAQKPRGPRKKKLENFHPYQDFGTFSWDWDLLAELKESYRETLQPQTRLEENLVDMLCHATLRLQRVPYLEHEYHATHPKGFLFNEKENHFGPFYRAESKHFYTQLFRYEASAQRSFYKALETLLKLQDERISGRGGAYPAPTGETMAIHHLSQACHPGGSRDPVARTIQSPEPSKRQAFPEDPLNWIPAPAGMTGSETSGDPAQKSLQKTPQISHQSTPAKRLKTPAPPANSPQGNRWLTQTLATVSQKIKAITQTLKHNLHQTLTTTILSLRGALATSTSVKAPEVVSSRFKGPRTGCSTRGIATPSARDDRESRHRCARPNQARPSKKASHPRGSSTSPSRSTSLNATGTDPPDSS